MKMLVTGAAGFIGSNFVRRVLEKRDEHVVSFDLLTYAGNLANLDGLDEERHTFVKGDIAQPRDVEGVYHEHGPFDLVMHFAAESHVDRSIESATDFVRTNVVGTQVLMDVSRKAGITRFVHVSTDEVYGSLGAEGLFTETTPLAPNSPYSASKAASDMLVRSYVKTYGFPAVTTRCSNNYGPYQFPEKAIPLWTTNALADEPLPLYGDGKNVRDWIHVTDHCDAVLAVLDKGKDGEVYNIGGECERENIQIAEAILDALDKPKSLIKLVTDRPGHDRRYAMDIEKISGELGWKPAIDFADGIASTVKWYVDNESWWREIKSGAYRDYYERMYGRRLSG